MSHLELNFLGGFEVRIDGQVITGFESDKTRLLLAYLVIESNRAHRRESLAGIFWPESSEYRARQSLSQALYNLRQVLGQQDIIHCLEQNAKEVTFRYLEGVSVDVTRFMSLVAKIDGHAHGARWACRTCIGHMQEAVALYRGELLTGFSLADSEVFEDWLRQQREYYQGSVVNLLQDLVKSFNKRGKLAEALEYVEKLVSLDPFDENNQRLWLSLLAQNGKRREALMQYQKLKQALSSELNVEPEDQTIQLYNQIRKNPEAFTTTTIPPHNLPQTTSFFVGRQEELEDLYWKLVDPACRVITILGIGGSGKTRLAIEAGRVLLPAFRDGVFWVELGGLRSFQDILAAMARVIGIRVDIYLVDRTQNDIEKVLFSAMQAKEMLLILDSAEGVIEAVSTLILLMAPLSGVKFLVTSRARLNLREEYLLVLNGLAYPTAVSAGWENYPAVQLFSISAHQSNAGFTLSPTNENAVIEICQTVQGIPLAIILATAWVATLSPQQILVKIRENIGFLEANLIDLPDRQHSLKATFEYSWSLLWEEEQKVLRRLAIFRQPFTAETAQHVTQATLFNIRSLQGFTLVQRSGEDRFRLHDLVRQFAQDKLAQDIQESQELYQRFCSFYLGKLVTWGKMLKTNQQESVLNEMDLEIQNVSLAWEWAMGNLEPRVLEDALEGLMNFYMLRWLFRSGAKACADGLAKLESMGIQANRLWVRLKIYLGYFWIASGDQQEGFSMLEAIVKDVERNTGEELDLRWEKALAFLFILKFKARFDNPYALQCADNCIELFQQCEDRWNEARAWTYAATALEAMGRYDEQIHSAERSLQLLGPDGDPNLTNYTNYILGCAYIFKGDQQKGIQIIRDSIHQFSDDSDDAQLFSNNFRQAVTYIYSGNFLEALRLEEINLATSQVKKIPLDPIEYAVIQVALLGMGRYQEILAFITNNKGSRHHLGTPLVAGMVYLLDEQNKLACQQFEHALQTAAENDDQRVMGEIKAFLSIACYRLGDKNRARTLLTEAIQKYQSASIIELSATLLAISYFLLEQKKIEQAVEIYHCAIKNPFFGKSTWTQDFLGKRLEHLSQSLPAEVSVAACARSESQDQKTILAGWLKRVDELIH